MPERLRIALIAHDMKPGRRSAARLSKCSTEVTAPECVATSSEREVVF